MNGRINDRISDRVSDHIERRINGSPRLLHRLPGGYAWKVDKLEIVSLEIVPEEYVTFPFSFVL